MYELGGWDAEWVDVDPAAALAWLTAAGEPDPPPPPDEPPPLLELVTLSGDADSPRCSDDVETGSSPGSDDGLDPLLDRLIGVRAEASRLAAAEVQILAELAEQDRYRIDGMAADLAAAAVGDTIAGMRNRIATALTLTGLLPATLTALRCGGLGYRKAELIAAAADRLTTVLPDYDTRRDLAHELEAAVLDRAGEQTPPQLTARLRRTALRLDPAGAETRHHLALADRSVRLLPADDGMAELRALLPAEHATLLHDRLTAATRLLPHHDPRSRDQQRADLLIDALLTGLPTGLLPTAQHTAPTVSVIVAASTLTGTDDQPGWLEKYGPITAGHARQLAHDPTGTWRRLVTDPAGQLLDYGTTRYGPPPALADLITIRDPVCVIPGCGRATRHCDLDHTRPHQHGGTTHPENLAPLCRHHHRLKTRRLLAYRRDPDGSYTTRYHEHGLTRRHRPPPRWTVPKPVESAQPQPDSETEAVTTVAPPDPATASRAREDQSYRDRIHRLRNEITAAHTASDTVIEKRLRTKLRDTRRHRINVLRQRQHPNDPPF